MPQQQQQQQTYAQQLSGTADVVHAAGGIAGGAIFPFIHYGRGTHALMWTGPMAFGAMFAYTGFAKCPAMIPYILAWAIANVVQFFLRDKNQVSGYQGYPLACKLPFVNTEAKGRVLESLLVLGLGLWVKPYNPPFGVFFIVVALAISARHMVEKAAVEKRLRTMRDAVLEQEAWAEIAQRRGL